MNTASGARGFARSHADRAVELASTLPPLLVAAERVAATVAQGVHGRRRVGVGDSFWQYRPFVEGDAVARIDWRRSGRSDRLYVRDTEWEAAQTVCLWRDASPSMAWRSARALPEKRERAELLLLALASLLFRAGEQVRLIGVVGRRFAGRAATTILADALRTGSSGDRADIPAETALPSHASIVLFGDFLGPLEPLRATLARYAAAQQRGHLVQILDPAEHTLPYEGRVRFRGLEAEADTIVPRVDAIRAGYTAALAAQQAGLAAIAAAAGFTFATHRTDAAPETALLALYMAMDHAAIRQNLRHA